MYIIPHQYFIEFMHNITSLARFVALSYYVSRKSVIKVLMTSFTLKDCKDI